MLAAIIVGSHNKLYFKALIFKLRFSCTHYKFYLGAIRSLKNSTRQHIAQTQLKPEKLQLEYLQCRKKYQWKKCNIEDKLLDSVEI